MPVRRIYVLLFFFNDTATTEIYTLSLHDALPISTSTRKRSPSSASRPRAARRREASDEAHRHGRGDRKSTRLNSSHSQISYAVFCLKKKNTILLQVRISRSIASISCLLLILGSD